MCACLCVCVVTWVHITLLSCLDLTGTEGHSKHTSLNPLELDIEILERVSNN